MRVKLFKKKKTKTLNIMMTLSQCQIVLGVLGMLSDPGWNMMNQVTRKKKNGNLSKGKSCITLYVIMYKSAN